MSYRSVKDFMTSISKLLINQNSSIRDALKIINDADEKICLVVDEKNVLLGTVTDGDVRRGLLHNHSLDESVQLIMNANPISTKSKKLTPELIKTCETNNVNQLPVVNKLGVIVDLLNMQTASIDAKIDVPVIIMAGGLGSRLGDLTRDTPKPMLQIGNKPLLEILIENLKSFGFWNFSLSVNYRADIIENHFKDGQHLDVSISYLRETRRLGTAGSLNLFKNQDYKKILVINGDVLSRVDFKEFLNQHDLNHYNASMCVRRHEIEFPFGVVSVKGNLIDEITEKPVFSNLVSAGIYILNREIVDLIPLDQYYDMPSLFNQISKKTAYKAGIFPIHEYWIDIGRKDDLDRAASDFSTSRK